jgi:hypothetical protein
MLLKIMKFLIVISLFIASVAQANSDLKPFTSDGCSVFPDGTLQYQELWLSCCQKHDLAYWQGGTFQQRVDADQELKQCVEQVGEPSIAAIMLAGVRVGGTPYLPNAFRWGYGWPYFRGYKAISPEEQTKIEALLNDSN